ncbi:MAG: 3D domain-containing protein [Solirubrobacteraceae bacterium]|jgi:3D (Asp-Asp-Asp) domain-containing protein
MPGGGLRLAAAGVVAVPLALAVLVAGLSGASPGCADAATSSAGSGGWTATAYGPPWTDGNGSGITATGLNLTAGPAMLEIAVDPTVIALGSYVYVQPNPLNTSSAFYAGDTGTAILGRHIDIYDWRGRTDQLAWGTRAVTVTPAPTPGAGNLLGAVPTTMPPAGASAAACASGTLGLTAGGTATIEPDGSALAPADAPAAVKLAIAAGNEIHTYPYPSPDVHYGPLSQLWPAYDCSGATSFVLYMAGLMGANAETSTELEDYGLAGAGRWITIYANSAHVWIVVAGIALDTAEYGGAAVPAGSGPRWRADPIANLQDGSAYVIRHPPGL